MNQRFLVNKVIEIICIFTFVSSLKTEEVCAFGTRQKYIRVVKKSRAFVTNNLYFLKYRLAGVSHVKIYATGSQKSNSGDCYRRDANLFGIISRKNP